MFFRVDDPLSLPAPLYFARAVRLGAYMGVMQARLAELRGAENGPPTGTTRAAPVKVDDGVMLSKLANEGWAEVG